jgi:hypothetical protein
MMKVQSTLLILKILLQAKWQAKTYLKGLLERIATQIINLLDPREEA